MAHLEERARAAATQRRRLRVPQPRRHRQRRRRRGAPRRADLPRALPRARDDGADQLHGARRRRQGRGVGADAGARPRAHGRPPLAAGVDEDAVTVHVTYLGGGFGRRLDVDFVGQAVRIAVETGGRPVQLVWSREEDMTHDFYRPAAVAILRAGLGADGLPVTLRVTSAGDAITPRWIERGVPSLAGPVDTPDKTTSEGLFDQLYAVPHQRIAHVATLERRADRLLALGRPFAQRVLRRVVRRRARARGRPRPGRLPARPAQGRATPRRGPAPRRRARRLARPGPIAAARRRAERAASRCTNPSAASSPRSSRRRSRTAGRACTASSAPPTSAPSSIRGSSPSRWKAR